MQEPIRRARIDHDPVLSFDNQSSDPTSGIDLVTVAEAASLMRISKTGIRRLQQARQLPFIKVGGSVRFAKRDLAAYLANRRLGALDI